MGKTGLDGGCSEIVKRDSDSEMDIMHLYGSMGECRGLNEGNHCKQETFMTDCSLLH